MSSIDTEQIKAKTTTLASERYVYEKNGRKIPKGINRTMLPITFSRVRFAKGYSGQMNALLKLVTISTRGITLIPAELGLSLLNGNGIMVSDITKTV